MNEKLLQDKSQREELLQYTLQEAIGFLDKLDQHPPGTYFESDFDKTLTESGLGGIASLRYFQKNFSQGLSGSAGSRYLGFVTGGSTPAALMGDWLASAFDQNVASAGDSSANQVEYQSIAWLRDLFGLEAAFEGTFVSGATMSNFVGLSIARQWYGKKQDIDIARQGVWGIPPLKIFSGSPHSSIYKALSMVGMGRECLEKIPVYQNREAIDLTALETALKELEGKPCVVVANSGTVNTVDFDDLEALGLLKQKYGFFLHVDAAFGGFAACSPKYRHFMQGLNHADSITIDMHKFLNVPYDSAVQFSRHLDIQKEVFQNSAARYLEVNSSHIPFVHLTPENSRRFRALPAWFTLLAYGKAGYCEIVERNATLAHQLGEWIKKSPYFVLLAEVNLNVVCFTLKGVPQELMEQKTNEFLKLLTQDGRVFMTPSLYQGQFCIRAAFSNWQSDHEDLIIILQALEDIGELMKKN